MTKSPLIVVGRDRRDEKISVVANAVGFELFAGDGRPIYNVTGVEQINVDADELDLCMRVARRVVDSLEMLQ